MKKILTFLVMLFACVSILSAQNEDRLAKFSYQAVVRDATNDFNLMMDTTVQIEVTINWAGSADGIEIAPQSKKTNRNGMVAFEIVEPEAGMFNLIDWSTASIKTVFKVNDTQVSVVESNVMAVPYALQANVDPLEITTKAICDYIASAQPSAVDSIFHAMTSNQPVSDRLKDSIVAYVKTQSDLVKQLAIFFLHTVNENDVEQAKDTLTQSAKNAIKNVVIDYLKENKDAAYEVLGYYLQHTSVNDVKALWQQARGNEDFDTIVTIVRDSAVKYIKNHPELVNNIVEYYIAHAQVQDVKDFYHYLKANNQPVYDAIKDKFVAYLNNYLENEYHAVKACDDITVCDLKEQLDSLITDASCPKAVGGWYTTENVSGTDIVTCHFTMNVVNFTNTEVPTIVVKRGDQSLEGVSTWEHASGVWTASYTDDNGNFNDPTFYISFAVGGCNSVITVEKRNN